MILLEILTSLASEAATSLVASVKSRVRSSYFNLSHDSRDTTLGLETATLAAWINPPNWPCTPLTAEMIPR